MAETINQTLENLRIAIDEFTEKSGQCCQPKGSKTGSEPSTQEPEYGGIDDPYPDAESFFDARCNAANGIYDTVLGAVDWLDVNHVDLKAGLFGGLTSGLTFMALASGPVGWAIIAAGTIVTALIIWVVRETLDFAALSTSLDDKHEELVKALYNASNVTAARTNFLAILATATPTPSSALLYLIEVMLGEDVLNNIFEPRSDVAAYQSPDPIDCGGVTLAIWPFTASGEGWAFRDDSTGTNSASGAWGAGTQSWEMEITTTSGETGIAKGTIYLTGLSIAVDESNSVQFDFSETSDGVNSSKHLWVKFADTSEFEEVIVGGSGAGTIILSMTQTGTIEEIECSLSRKWNNASVFDRNILEVRVQ